MHTEIPRRNLRRLVGLHHLRRRCWGSCRAGACLGGGWFGGVGWGGAVSWLDAVGRVSAVSWLGAAIWAAVGRAGITCLSALRRLAGISWFLAVSLAG